MLLLCTRWHWESVSVSWHLIHKLFSTIISCSRTTRYAKAHAMFNECIKIIIGFYCIYRNVDDCNVTPICWKNVNIHSSEWAKNKLESDIYCVLQLIDVYFTEVFSLKIFKSNDVYDFHLWWNFLFPSCDKREYKKTGNMLSTNIKLKKLKELAT